MKPLFIGLQMSVVLGFLIVSYYLGRPVYWEIRARVTESVKGTSLTTNGISVGFEQEDANISNGNSGKRDDIVMEKAAGTEEDAEHFELEGSSQISSKNGVLKNQIWERPHGHKMPPSNAFMLTKEMVNLHAANNVIVVTFANYAFLDFVLNWVRHLTELKVFNILVGAMDTEILKALYWEGIPVFDMGSNVNTIDVGWGTPIFHKMGREKVILVRKFLSMGFELLMCDTDMVWLQNPLPYFARYPAADVLVSSDEVVNTVEDEHLEVWERAQGAYNIGIFYWRPSEVAKKFAQEWLEQLLGDDRIWDQNGFNDLMRGKQVPIDNGDSGLFYAYDGTLKLGILPVSIFCSGHTYFVQALYKQLELKPYAVHTTFQYAGTEGKRHRLREARVFYDKPDYYDPPGGLLAFQSDIPQDLLTSGKHSVDTHFKLINYQIRQIRDALAIAFILNRTLVMPALWCRLDRMWYGHPGILPGTRTRQPFLCPMDHVFEVNNMLKSLEEAEYGPLIDFREYSFLENPRLPVKMNSSKIIVELCMEEAEWCGTDAKGVNGKLKLPKNSTDDKIEAALSGYNDKKIIQFSTMEYVFGGFTDKEKERKFRKRVKRYTGIWCCVQNAQPGRIYYDMYWDEKPNWKPLPPHSHEDDHPPW
eukprot:c18467_g1_i1 orf=594-2531(-)